MPLKSISPKSYRYGFQGQEEDDEWLGGQAVSYKYRVHDPRVGRFLSIDPLAPKYPHNSPYAFSENRVIDGVELEGLEYISDEDLTNNPQSGSSMSANDDGTFNISFGNGIEYNNVSTVEYDGETYYDIGEHLYNNDDGWSKSGSESDKMTTWVYNQLSSPTLNQSDWVKYSMELSFSGFGECAAAAAESCDNAGAKPYGGWAINQVYNTSSTNLTSWKRPDQASKSLSLDLIQLSLEGGHPIMVGVDYPNGQNRGGDNYTDHYIVIYDRGYDSNGEYFLFSENVANDAASGMSNNRKLYLQNNGTSLQTRNASDTYNSSQTGGNYTVTGVRLNSYLKENYKSRINGVNSISY